NAVPILDGKMSRYHFGIARLADGGFELVDNQATNGTYLNGERVDRRPLKTGDEIQAGNTTIRVEILEGGAKTTPQGAVGRFVVQSPEGSFETEGDFITVGRVPDNHVPLDDGYISREHSHLIFREGRYYLKDNNSFNGTFLNLQRIVEEPIGDGDVAQYGPFLLEFKLPTPL